MNGILNEQGHIIINEPIQADVIVINTCTVKNSAEEKLYKQIKKFPQMFKEDQIVGAKDKENNWWLARVLNVFTTPECDSHWYYVRFEGWGAKHDEWINARTYRVRNYNPKKHFLKRQLTK